jgi:ATP-dependent DNA ligase
MTNEKPQAAQLARATPVSISSPGTLITALHFGHETSIEGLIIRYPKQGYKRLCIYFQPEISVC